MKDASLIVAEFLPAAAANVNTAALDLGAPVGGGGGITPCCAELEVAIPALPALANDKVATVKVQDSADNVTFVDTGLQVIRTGAGGVGDAAKTVAFRMPLDLRRYVRLNLAVDAAGGDNTGKNVSLSVVTH